MSPGWVRTQVRTHSDFCWTRGLGLGLWSNGLGLGLGLWSSGLGLTPDELGLWPDGLGLGLRPCGLGFIAGLTSPDSLQHWWYPQFFFMKMTAKDVKEITQMPLVTFFSVLELPEKNRKGVATTPPLVRRGLNVKGGPFASHLHIFIYFCVF